jgi:hypothetical protein
MKATRRGPSQRSAFTALSRCPRGSVLAIVLTLASTGCMIPSYQLPAGFSSTYQRQIYGMEPAPPDPRVLGLAAVETQRGIFYPTTAFHDQAAVSQQSEDRKAVEPFLLGSDTPQKPQRASASDF